MEHIINDKDGYQGMLFSEALEDYGMRGDTLES